MPSPAKSKNLASKPAAEWISRVKEAYEAGCSDVEVCKIMGITMSQFDKYYEGNDNFARFIDMGRTLSRAWWYSQGRTNLENRGFNTPLWGFNMKNRYGWADKTEQIQRDDIPVEMLSKDELQSRIAKLQGMFNKQAQLENLIEYKQE